MVDDIHQRDNHGQSRESQRDQGYRNQLWKKAEDALRAEVYTDFVPRWSKKKKDKELPSYKTKLLIGWLSPAIKLTIGTMLYPLLIAFDFGEYKTIIGGIGIYLAVDGVYQLLDLRGHSYHKDIRKAATLAVDLLTYPFYLISSRTPHGYRAK